MKCAFPEKEKNLKGIRNVCREKRLEYDLVEQVANSEFAQKVLCTGHRS
jgi:hypothetical protein